MVFEPPAAHIDNIKKILVISFLGWISPDMTSHVSKGEQGFIDHHSRLSTFSLQTVQSFVSWTSYVASNIVITALSSKKKKQTLL